MSVKKPGEVVDPRFVVDEVQTILNATQGRLYEIGRNLNLNNVAQSKAVLEKSFELLEAAIALQDTATKDERY